ncbi:MAG: hypothetical protein ABIM21_03850, partial [candidate division WOR-3 bacterium]
MEGRSIRSVNAKKTSSIELELFALERREDASAKEDLSKRSESAALPNIVLGLLAGKIPLVGEKHFRTILRTRAQ